MNELTVKENNNGAIVAAADVANYKEIAIKWLESTGNLKKFTESQKAQFIDICEAYKLNPIKKEVYGVPYGDKFNLIVGYEAYIKRAERSGLLNGWGVEIIGKLPEMKAVITIHRKDWNAPFTHEVYFEEYNTNQNLWKTKPRTMLKKVAIAQGFRMCFSEELGGIPYTADELPEEMTQPVVIAETATVKAQTTDKLSEKPLKNITLKFTKAQAEELGEVVNSTFKDGSPIFTEEEKETYRNMLKMGEFENAIVQARNLVDVRELATAADQF